MSENPVTLFFGQRWDAPDLDDAHQVDTPVGQPCRHCDESIVAGDRGLLRAAMYAGPDGTWIAIPKPTHAECALLPIMGHIHGICRCNGYDDSRASAHLLWRVIGKTRGRDLAIRDDDPPPRQETL